jgi:hypothetical protein
MGENRQAVTRRVRLSKPTARARVTNGTELVVGVDGRTLWVRRFKDLLALHLSDLGGEDNCSEAEKALVRRSACLIVELEQMEAKFAERGDGASVKQLQAYQRVVNTLRRTLESLGLKRRPRDVTPDPLTYARQHAHEVA